MAARDIAAAMRRTEQILLHRPAAGRREDTPAVARWAGGARCLTGDGGGREVATDLPQALGGAGEEVSPGWLVRAGLAACLATSIAVAAAREGIALGTLEVEATSRSDLRGLFGMTAADGAPVDPGPRDVEMTVRISAPGVMGERLRALVDAAHRMSPVASALQLAVPLALRVEVAG